MTVTTFTLNNRKPVRGFTLTEIAIVLGIVGLVLGAIWVAAASVYSNFRLGSANKDLILITQNVRALYATSHTVDPAANMAVAGANGGAQATYLGNGIFPIDTLDTGAPSTATQAFSPWDGNISIQGATQVIADDAFVVVFNAVPAEVCANLLTSIAGTSRDPGLYRAGGGGAGGVPAGVALAPGTGFLPSVAKTQCTAPSNGNAIAFYFSLRGGT